MRWRLSYRFDPRALPLANAHYNRQTPESPQFVPPGRCLVLLSREARALWVTSWPQFAQHDWGGAWINSLFRNVGAGLSSELILEAVAATRAHFGAAPELGMVTFVDPKKVKRKRDPGRCYLRAGFRRIATTPKGLLVFQLLPDAMPAPRHALCDTPQLGALL